jgi:transcriptional regulator with XRE-family HTH domain
MQEEIFKNIGFKLRILRRLNKLTLQNVAEFLNITSAQVQKYETGESRISIPTLFKIAHFYKINTSYFFEDFEVNLNYDKLNLEMFIEFNNVENYQLKKDILLLVKEMKNKR